MRLSSEIIRGILQMKKGKKPQILDLSYMLREKKNTENIKSRVSWSWIEFIICFWNEIRLILIRYWILMIFWRSSKRWSWENSEPEIKWVDARLWCRENEVRTNSNINGEKKIEIEKRRRRWWWWWDESDRENRLLLLQNPSDSTGMC